MNQLDFLHNTFLEFLKRYDNVKNANSREKVKSKVNKIEEFITIEYRKYQGSISSFIENFDIEKMLNLMNDLYNSSVKPITKPITMRNYMSYTLQYLGFMRRKHQMKNNVESNKTKSEELTLIFDKWIKQMGLIDTDSKSIISNENLIILEQDCRDKIEDYLETKQTNASDFKLFQSAIATLISIELIAKNETLQTLDIKTVESEIENNILTLNKMSRKIDSYLSHSIKEFIKYRNDRASEGITTLFINDKGNSIGDENEYLFSIVKKSLEHQSIQRVNQRVICNLMQEEKGITHTEIKKISGYKDTVVNACDKKVYFEKTENEY